MDLAVIIVTWNNEAVIADALGSLQDDLSANSMRYEIRVVDCASTDATVAVIRRDFPAVILTTCDENIGFGRANNHAMRSIGFEERGRERDLPGAVYLLNPDTVTHTGATKALFDALFADAGNGVVGARLSFADGSFQHSAFRFPDLRQIWTELYPTPSRWIDGSFNGRYPRSSYDASDPFEVDFALGATMMLRREVLQEVGLFDEQFFIYCEEVDWQWRIREHGWRILCVPQARITHLGGGSSSQARPASLFNLWKSRLQLYDKHYPPWKRWMARRLVARGLARRMASMPSSESELIDACQQVIELARS